MGNQGLGGRVAVAASCALLGVCLAGGPLYVSSAASESVQLQLADTCLSDVAIHLPYSADPVLMAALDHAFASLRGVEAPVVTQSMSATYRLEDSPALERAMVLVHRQGQETQFDPLLAPLSDGEVLVPEYLVAAGEFVVGRTQLEIQEPVAFRINDDGAMEPLPDAEVEAVSMSVVGTYPRIAVRPEPSFWCGWREQLRPNSRGDPPPPMVLASAASIEQFGQAFGDWEVRPQVSGMTRDDARSFQRRGDAATVAFAAELGVDPDVLARQFAPLSTMGVLADRAETAAELVRRTMAPVRFAGVAVSVFVLSASGVMVSRERRRELRLVAVRGGGPWSSTRVLTTSLVVPAIGGGVLGLGLAVLGVITLGPTPEFETGPMRTAVISSIVGGIVALGLVVAVTAVSGDRTVDTRPSRRAWRKVPFELVVPVLAVVAFARLDRVGGVRLVGDAARGGDLLAQSFPLLALAAPVVVLVRPLRWMIGRGRHVGRRLPDAWRLGVRRAVAEPLSTVMVILASAFAAGCLVLSSTLLVSAQRQLIDKATTFIGSDQSIRLGESVSLPAVLADRATVIGRLSGKADDQIVSILAIDPSTFLRGVHWLDDPELDDLAALVQRLRVRGQRAAAIVVGDLPATFDLTSRNTDAALAVDVIAELRHFPGYSRGSTMVIVDRATLDAAELGRIAPYVWIRDPPPDAVQLLRDGGARVTNEGLEVDDVFDATSFRAVRWSYSVLGAFGVFIASVVLMMQFLAIDARRQRRQAAHVVMSRMGFDARRLSVASAVEIGLPLVAGVVVGVVLGAIVATISVPRLDTMRHLRPPAIVVIDASAISGVAIATLVALAVLALLTVVSTTRARPLEVMRGTV